MPTFDITATVIRPADEARSRVTDLMLGANGWLYSTTRLDGVITAWDISGISPIPTDTSGFASGVIAGNQPALVSLMTQTGLTLLSGGGGNGDLTLRDLGPDGALGAATDLPTSFTAPLVQPVALARDDGHTTVYAGLSGGKGLVQLDLGPAGAVTQVTYLRDLNRTAAGDVTALTSATEGDTRFLVGASTKDAGITAWLVHDSGLLSDTSTLRPDDGLRLATPTALDSVSVGGDTYIIAAGATSDSLTVLGLDATRALRITDHVMDNRETRFEGVTALATTTHQGQAWVFAGGADDGISAFQLLPGGRLLHRAHIADTATSTLANISALAVRSETSGIAVFATSATEAGLTRLMLRIDAADQVILDTSGSDVLTGGAGADVFVFGADGTADTISDFTLGTDRLDLSGWTGLRRKDQLTFEAMPDGLRITYGEEVLRLQSANGQTLAANDLLETDLIAQTTLPLVLTPGQPGPVTTPPALPDRYIQDPGTPAPLPGPERVEAYGTGGDDDSIGGVGPDLLFGQAGNDRLRGASGDDLLFGGPGQDRLDGGADDDQLFGGAGRDLGWLTPNDPVQSLNGDVLGGGTGDDRLYGQAGRDRLDGGTGDDLLVGGGGRDTFVFRSGHDVIADFDPLLDNLLLDQGLWNGALDAAAVVDRFAITDGGHLVLQFDADHSLHLEGVDDPDLLASQLAFL